MLEALEKSPQPVTLEPPTILDDGDKLARNHFLQLPLEIRELIISYTVQPVPRRLKVTYHPEWLSFLKYKPFHPPNLLFVSRQLFHETVRILYSDVTILIPVSRPVLYQLSRCLGMKYIHSIDLAFEWRAINNNAERRIFSPYSHVKLLTRLRLLAPKLQSLSLTICENSLKTGQHGIRNSNPEMSRFSLESLLRDSDWKLLITALRVQLDGPSTNNLRGISTPEDDTKYKISPTYPSPASWPSTINKALQAASRLPHLETLNLILTTKLTTHSYKRSIVAHQSPERQRLSMMLLQREAMELSIPLQKIGSLFSDVKIFKIERLVQHSNSIRTEPIENMSLLRSKT